MAEVVIFGAGPSGLMAAHAAEAAGHEVVKLYDADPKPPDGTTAGVFYLHAPCGLDVRSQVVRVGAEGEQQEYARRVYGDPHAPCNWPSEPYETLAWDGMQAMLQLWWRYGHLVERAQIRTEDIQVLCLTEPQRRFISTVPLDRLIEQELPHSATQILTMDPGLDYHSVPHMIYMGIPGVDTVRRSYVFGKFALEAPMDVDWATCPEWNRHVVKKVMRSVAADANVALLEHRHPNLFFTGRYGKWDKTMLTHKVYNHVIGRLAE